MTLAIITGAAQGIGRRTAELFAAAGYSLALLDLKPCPPLPNADALTLAGDLTDESFIASGAPSPGFAAMTSESLSQTPQIPTSSPRCTPKNYPAR
ncbi:SDR family NAD(P)-dependent oxidoreductase, partial [Edaphobacter aggregans]|uniref:SDR family NAD(P)-dependent oxidoreductase n=1 Tax=Edaphobacter aggregans TaxID=570835 RepID=UPI00054E8D65